MQLAAQDFIPHQAPMVFVDHIVEIGEDFAVAELLISTKLMFCEPQGLPTWSSVELMAQTVSTFAGFKSHQLGRKPKIGYLLGTRKLALPMSHFEIGSVVRIRAQQQYLHEGLGQFSCEIEYAGHQIQAMLNVYEPVEGSEDMAMQESISASQASSASQTGSLSQASSPNNTATE